MRFMLSLHCHRKHHTAKLSVKNNLELWHKIVCPSLLLPVLLLQPCVEWLSTFSRRWSIRDELVQTVSDGVFTVTLGQSHIKCLTGHWSTKRAHSCTSVISCRRVDAMSWPGKLRNSQLFARAILPKHNPVSETSLKCILPAGSMQQKCQASCCNKFPVRQLASGAHFQPQLCSINICSYTVSASHRQGCSKQLWVCVGGRVIILSS